jgi:hypothetical protein
MSCENGVEPINVDSVHFMRHTDDVNDVNIPEGVAPHD